MGSKEKRRTTTQSYGDLGLNGRVPQTTSEHTYVTVILDITPSLTSPKSLQMSTNGQNLKKKLKEYIDEGLSIKQIADKLGTSKTWMVDYLKSQKIDIPSTGRMTNPENYRHHTAPFGWRVSNGKLVPCQKQQRVCRLVVQLRKIEKLSFNTIAKRLVAGSYRNGVGGLYWDHKAVSKIFNNWKDKY